jgi:hypothetical protein
VPALSSYPVDEAGSFVWIAHPAELMERASLALVADGGTYLIDPVDAPHLGAALQALPPVVAVVRLLDRHGRDCDALAARHGVTVRPGFAGDPAVPGATWIRIPAMPGWREGALYLPDRRLLVVAEALGTAAYYRHPVERIGVHPVLRLRPPRRQLEALQIESVACGHGAPVTVDAASAVGDALRHARRRLLRTVLRRPGGSPGRHRRRGG